MLKKLINFSGLTFIFLFIAIYPNLTHADVFYSDLKIGVSSQEVKELQIMLNKDPDTKITSSGAGASGNETDFFGLLTHTSVIKFQNKYAAEILAPAGLTQGTGFVGYLTRKKLNTMHSDMPNTSNMSSNGLSVSEVSTDSLKLSWDNLTTSPTAKYIIFDGKKPILTDKNFYNLSNLSPNTNHTFTVIAFDSNTGKLINFKRIEAKTTEKNTSKSGGGGGGSSSKTPAASTSNDDTSTIPDTPKTKPIVGQKYNPGHYVTLSQKDAAMLDDSTSKSNDGEVFAQKLKDAGVVGVVVRYPWKQFEPTQNNYSYTRVNQHLDLLNSKGLKMVVFVDDKSFTGEAVLPDYIKNNSDYIFVNKTDGVSAIRWNPFVKERFINLWTDMGEELDEHPALEGVVYPETAMSIPTSTVTVPPYDPVVNKQIIIDTLTAQSDAFSKSNVFWMMNYFPNGYHNGQFLGNAIVDTYIGDIADTVLPLGVIMGGPDILPEDSSLIKRTYPYYDEFNDKGMKLFASAQNDSFRHLHGGNTTLPFYTPLEIFNYGKNELHANYIWWNYKTWVSKPDEKNKKGVIIPSGEYVWDDAIPVIKANPTFNTN